MTGQQVGEDAFGFVLGEDARLGIGGVVLRPGQLAREVEVDRLVGEGDRQLRGRRARREGLLDHTEVVEDLERSRLDDERAGGGRRLLRPVDDARCDAVSREFVGQQESGRARADYQDAEIGCAHVHHLTIHHEMN